jgi:hypothetical protein
MKTKFKHLVPSSFELVGGGFLAIIIIFLANSKSLLSYYGLSSSDQLIKSSADNVVSEALTVIDSFSATNGVVTFLIWAVVGIVCFGIVEALGNGYQQIKLEKQVSSKSYIHPTSFSQARFWRSVVLDTITLLLGLGLLALVLLAFALLVLPLGLAYSRVFIFSASFRTALDLVLGLFVIFTGLIVTSVTIRLLLYRRSLFNS